MYTLNDAPTQGADQPQGCNREPNGKVSTKEIVRPVALLSASPVAEVLATSPQLSIVGGTASRFAHTPFQYHRSKKAVWIPDYCLIDLPCLAREPTVAMQQYIHLEYPVDKRQLSTFPRFRIAVNLRLLNSGHKPRTFDTVIRADLRGRGGITQQAPIWAESVPISRTRTCDQIVHEREMASVRRVRPSTCQCSRAADR